MTKLIEPYNPFWKAGFDMIAVVLGTQLTGLAVTIEHVGSTAIPGLCAKPILDIDIIMHREADADEINKRLLELGYFSKGEHGVKGRQAYRQFADTTPRTLPAKQWQTHHLYVCAAGNIALKNHLAFRDALLRDKALVEQYAGLKNSLVVNPDITRATYTIRKTDFIVAVLQKEGLTEAELQEIRDANR